jgi:hypothetical protein
MILIFAAGTAQAQVASRGELDTDLMTARGTAGAATPCSKTHALPPDPSDSDNAAAQNGSSQAPTYLDARTKKTGLGSAAHPLTPAIYDSITPARGATYLAIQGSCWGLLAENGRVLLPPEFFSIEITSYPEWSDAIPPRNGVVLMAAGGAAGQMLYRIDVIQGKVEKSAGPFDLIRPLDFHVGENTQRHALVSDHQYGHVGLIDANLDTVLPLKYDGIKGVILRGGTAVWITFSERQPPARIPRDFIQTYVNTDALWTFNVFDLAGKSLFNRRGHFLHTLAGNDGLSVQQADHTCLYLDLDFHAFTSAQWMTNEKGGYCRDADNWNRLFLRRTDGVNVVWTLSPLPADLPAGTQLWINDKDDDTLRKLRERGGYRWQLTYQGDFAAFPDHDGTTDVTTTGGDFALIQQTTGKKPRYKLIDLLGHDTGGIYDKYEVDRGSLRVYQGKKVFETRARYQAYGQIVRVPGEGEKVFDLDFSM